MKDNFWNRITGQRRRFLEAENEHLTEYANHEIEEYVASMIKEMKIDFTKGSFEVWATDPLIHKCATLLIDMIRHSPEIKNFLTLTYADGIEHYEITVENKKGISISKIAGDFSEFTRKIDWKLLRHQKQMLLDLSPANAHRIQLEARDGVVNLLDQLQDLAVKLEYAKESDVFFITED